jgi:alkylated DNA repair dioxygenase AlkB
MRDLFDEGLSELNLLPYDGSVFDHGQILSDALAGSWLRKLLDRAAWAPDQALVGEHIVYTGRHVAWYANEPFRYTHSGVTRQALEWDDDLLGELRTLVEAHANTRFNSCLLNLYHGGSQGMTWHSDSEAYGEHAAIASLSLGATCKFVFKHKRSQEKKSLNLYAGQLILMHGETQRHWLHAVMKTAVCVGARVSLTFRNFIP